MGDADEEITPERPIRRFDVFAEVNRLKALADGKPEDEAKGYGVWLAKVVAGRRFGRKADGADRPARRDNDDGRPQEPEPKFRHAGDELQTDETFDLEIVERMGSRFYARVFAPAIEEAVEGGEQYETFRDSIRKDWKPAKQAGRSKAESRRASPG